MAVVDRARVTGWSTPITDHGQWTRGSVGRSRRSSGGWCTWWCSAREPSPPGVFQKPVGKTNRNPAVTVSPSDTSEASHLNGIVPCSTSRFKDTFVARMFSPVQA